MTRRTLRQSEYVALLQQGYCVRTQGIKCVVFLGADEYPLAPTLMMLFVRRRWLRQVSGNGLNSVWEWNG